MVVRRHATRTRVQLPNTYTDADNDPNGYISSGLTNNFASGWQEMKGEGNAHYYNSAHAPKGLTDIDGYIATRDGLYEEYCIHNPARIDQIETIMCETGV